MRCKVSISTLFLLAAIPMSALAADPQAPAGEPQIDMPATAAGIKSDASPLFNQLDSNHDGYLSKEEAKRSADTSARFDSLDSNQDGRVSASEFNAPQGKP